MMPLDLPELRKLRQAVAARPDDVDLRLSLIAALLESGHPQSAWHHSLRILSDQPEHIEALRAAHNAAAAAGWPHRAQEYADRLATLEPEPAAAGEKVFRIKGLSLRLIRGGREDSGIHSPPR